MPNKFRPPIVTIMGHIDHGKTTLLDKIRSTSVAAREAGGITQHISVYQTDVKTKSGKTGTITFIDTPGHAAFCQMRTRGAQVTDLVVLVISGVDGIMAQTKECIKEIKNSGVPLIIAMTKMDLAEASPEKVKGQLVEAELTPEEYGGQISVVPVSGKTGLGIDELLELILLNSEIMELKDEPQALLDAVVIESKMDKNRGPVATMIVKKGTIKLGDQIFAENISCKVKAMIGSDGKPITEAIPSTPVEALGFESVPSVGAIVSSVKGESKEKQVISRLNQTRDDGSPRLPIVIKADVQGTLEALLGSLSDDVFLVAGGVGPVTDNDIFLAKSAKAEIFAFNVSIPRFIKNLADNEKVPLFESKIIYEIIEDIQSQVLKMLDPTIEETTLAEAKIIAEFKIEKVRIAGIEITKGEITKGDSVHLKRDGIIIKDTKVEGIHQAKNIIDKIKAGNQCGMTFKPYVDFKLGDVIIAYKVEK
jgi:translation initiation factor IF-2